MPQGTTPSPHGWTVRSSVEASFRLGLEHFTAFFVVSLIFAAPALVLETRGVTGIPKYLADILGNVAAFICILCATLHALDDHVLNVQDTLWQIHRPTLAQLLVLGAIQSIATIAGAFLVVPALHLMTIWIVAMPVMLVEDTGIVESFRRSAFLTSGRRWRVLGASALCVLLAFLVFNAVSLVLGIIPIVAERAELLPLLRWVVGAIVAAFIYPLSAILYVLLRQEKEGLTIAQIAGTLN